MKVEFYKHSLGKAEEDAILEACRGTILTTGSHTKQAEEVLASYMGLQYGVGLDSCTAALHLALLAMGIGPGDEVITTPMTFVATACSIMMAGATPVFVDVESETGNMDASLVEAAITPRTKAIMPVHLYGVLCDMRSLRDIADRHGLRIIEDAAHCIEGRRDGYGPGELGDCACLSFYATKNICCGEGGMLVTNSQDFADTVRGLCCHGVDKPVYDRYNSIYNHWDMPVLGWKYNLDNIRASLVPPQVKRLDDNLANRERLASLYEEGFTSIDGVDFPRVPADALSARHLQTCWVPEDIRDHMLLHLQDAEIGVTVNYRAIHLLQYFREELGHEPGSFPNAESIGNRTISLPLYPALGEEEAAYVIDALASGMDKLCR